MTEAKSMVQGAVIGLLKGFSQSASRLEVEVIVPHREDGLPGFGEVLLVEAGPGLAIVGRVCHYQAAGRLMTDQGDAYLADLSRQQDGPPAGVVSRLLRYTLRLQLLGHLRLAGGRFAFAVGERALPRFGSPVREPSDDALAYLCSVNLEGDPSAAELGGLAYGREVRDAVPVKFSVARLKGRRSFVFARAGYGKSNLVKYLAAQLYRSPPDVGLLIFDPEGEYALPDAHGRPGLVNVPGLAGRISLYTSRVCPPEHQGCVKGTPYLDLTDFTAGEVLANFLPDEKQDTVFANLVRGLGPDAWKKLVDLLARDEFRADDGAMAQILRYRASNRPNQSDVSLAAIKNNLVPVIRRLHKPGAPAGRNIIQDLREARVVIIDISLLGADDARAVSGLLLWRIFAHNRRHFTDVNAPVVRCLAVLEEAQTVLGDRDLDDRNIFVRWVKEGRKYGLGAVLVTQQPGAISDAIISQGDNFFVLHLLNERDLSTLKRHNGYFTDDILGVIQGEPIPGNCYFWCAPDQPFVLSARVHDFASVCAPSAAAPAAPAAPAPPEASAIRAKLAQALADTLAANLRVWIYPVTPGDPRGGEKAAFSADYLLGELAALCREGRLPSPGGSLDSWLREELPAAVAEILRAQGAVRAQATLAGITRPVWVLDRAAIKLRAPKRLQKESVSPVARA